MTQATTLAYSKQKTKISAKKTKLEKLKLKTKKKTLKKLGLFDLQFRTHRRLPEKQYNVLFSYTSLWRGEPSDSPWTIHGESETVNRRAPLMASSG